MKTMPIDEFNADQLRGFISVARRRLVELTADNCRLAESISGQESAKRAIQVAAAGGHDMVIYGPSGTGADRLVILAAQFGVAAYAVELCPCGRYTDIKRTCECTPGAIRKHWTKVLARPEIRTAAIHTEARSVPFLQVGRPGLDFDTMSEYVGQVGDKPPAELADLDHSGNCFMRQAANKLGFSVDTITVVLSVAATIAALDHNKAVLVQHIAEAIQYRRFDRPMFPA